MRFTSPRGGAAKQEMFAGTMNPWGGVGSEIQKHDGLTPPCPCVDWLCMME